MRVCEYCGTTICVCCESRNTCAMCYVICALCHIILYDISVTPHTNTHLCVVSFAHKKYKTGAMGAARSPKKGRNVRTGRPQPRCIMPDRSMRSRSWHPAQKAAIRISKGAPKATQITIGVICVLRGVHRYNMTKKNKKQSDNAL